MNRPEHLLFNDIFRILELSAAFDRVSRLKARSDNYDTCLTLDFNSEVYPLKVNEKFTLTLTSSLSLDSSTSSSTLTNHTSAMANDSWHEKLPTAERDISDEYEYVCHGRCYKFEEKGQQVSVYISFGGLLLCLEGNYKHLQNFTKGEKVFLLMRK
ncbi:DNA-directed RNA polymerases I, II, and III subunit RPABC3 [Coelomomyces lativittatus]|nr:DNA-directed RNA polymerases I, II, and III subunit RPABC3 [Coelomomyces lativittatus]